MNVAFYFSPVFCSLSLYLQFVFFFLSFFTGRYSRAPNVLCCQFLRPEFLPCLVLTRLLMFYIPVDHLSPLFLYVVDATVFAAASACPTVSTATCCAAATTDVPCDCCRCCWWTLRPQLQRRCRRRRPTSCLRVSDRWLIRELGTDMNTGEPTQSYPLMHVYSDGIVGVVAGELDLRHVLTEIRLVF